ncbi:MAG: UvrD-helicase domain-containing protein [Legionella sp.]|jgi:ATP-dependent exoDNAse (exonuclease V) beta subunit
MMLIDAEQRSQATNPSSSFIVQAPAGSGKTEILTQRFLRLLSTVEMPEQIIALTFTRKAASEMRERIIVALQKASASTKANSPHQQKTLDYAHQALQRSKQFNWDLLQQSNRLKIITIDALCQSIANAIPLLEQQISYASITDKAKRHYLNAARNCISFALETKEYQTAIKTLLLHVDNRQDRLISLFQELLGQRDQWLGPLFQARAQDKSHFEYALRFIEEHALERFKQSLPLDLAKQMLSLARELAAIENDPKSPRYILRSWDEFTTANQELAFALSKLLLTGEGNFRVAFDHHVGLKRGACPDEDYDRIKAASKKLLLALAEYSDFLEALVHVSQLPNPQYDPEQWQVLQALFLLLPLLASHLHLSFSEHNEVDFSSISQQALAALGESDNPTDLALYLDNSIHHLLVDEFQDTSINQFALITQLVQGWQKGDGRTLFLVGDPMQSIYRFRQAEVGLFFRAKEQGIGPVLLEFLELTCNFRSTATIVDWVNTHFAKLFPKQVDIESGAVSFHPSHHVIENNDETYVHAYECTSKELEAKNLIQIINYELQENPDKRLAILVRSRSQLSDIIRLLREHKIPYQGTDIDLLANLDHVRDVWSLTQSLLYPANRLSWLALLRSPYCGLGLNDVLAVANFNPKLSIYYSILELEHIKDLTEEGRIRLQYFATVMHKALKQRYQSTLTQWVASTLEQLHVNKLLNQNQKNDLEQFWLLLDSYEQQGRIPDQQEFLDELNNLYSQQVTPSRLQVMTIHKSKGLEFDTVFLPGLAAQPNRGDSPMLRWLKLPTHNHGDLLLVSPIRAAHQEYCALYDYMSRIDAEKAAYESQRVLYVAATRAKSRLYLLCSSSKTAKGSFKSFLKHQTFELIQEESSEDEIRHSLPKLVQLPLYLYQNTEPGSEFINPPPAHLAPGIPRLTGVVTHQLLQWICDNHPATSAEIPWNLAQYEFKKLGFDAAQTVSAMHTLQEQINALFADAIGSWIIKAHQQEQNEYELLVNHNQKIVTRIIDRTFIEKDILWIIDFKTGKEDEVSLSKHQQQLNEYAYYLSSRTDLTIRCGLLYLVNMRWDEWAYEHSKNI